MFVVKRVQKVAALPRQDDTVGNKLRRHSVVRCLEELSTTARALPEQPMILGDRCLENRVPYDGMHSGIWRSLIIISEEIVQPMALERMRGSPQQWSQWWVSDTNLIHRLPAAQHLLFFIARTYLGQQRYIPIGLWKPRSIVNLDLASTTMIVVMIWDVRDVTAKQPTNDSAHAVGVRAKYNAINILFILNNPVAGSSGTLVPTSLELTPQIEEHHSIKAVLFSKRPWARDRGNDVARDGGSHNKDGPAVIGVKHQSRGPDGRRDIVEAYLNRLKSRGWESAVVTVSDDGKRKDKKKMQIQIQLAKAKPRSKAERARPHPEHRMAPIKQTRHVQKASDPATRAIKLESKKNSAPLPKTQNRRPTSQVKQTKNAPQSTAPHLPQPPPHQLPHENGLDAKLCAEPVERGEVGPVADKDEFSSRSYGTIVGSGARADVQGINEGGLWGLVGENKGVENED
ncbi:hypothetical protein B0H13DRAFT_1861449 [Mycena leptocephala]|nr:hypothetical protein B0H13DRAFT_1861449 [Mycena leptocephala]